MDSQTQFSLVFLVVNGDKELLPRLIHCFEYPFFQLQTPVLLWKREDHLTSPLVHSLISIIYLLEVVGSTAWDEQQTVSNIVNILPKDQGKHKEFVETNTTFEDVSNVTETTCSTSCAKGSEDVLK